MSTGPSPHLTWAELACHDGTPYPEQWRLTRAIPLAVEFEHIRRLIGQPITILSAYRTVAYNKRIRGAAKNSQHTYGHALDLATPKGKTVADLLHAALRVASWPNSQLKGIGEYPWGIHIDIRRSDRLVRWSGNKPVQVARTSSPR